MGITLTVPLAAQACHSPASSLLLASQDQTSRAPAIGPVADSRVLPATSRTADGCTQDARGARATSF